MIKSYFPTLLVCTAIFFCQQTRASADQSAEQERIKRNAEQFVEAFNRGDADAIANLFSEDAELVESDSSRFVGREEIGLAYQ